MDEQDVIIRRQGKLGRLTLNRPRVLNALTVEMCETVLASLAEWEHDPEIAAVLIDAVPGRAFCVGGDIRAVYEWGKAEDPRVMNFFATEYRMNAAIARYSKPYVSILNGMVMGGGAGISVHGKFRVATENTMFAMPETAIGFFPDVGGSYFLSRCPGRVGLYLGMTGARIDASDMLYAGLATHCVSANDIEPLISQLVSGGDPQAVIAAFAMDTDKSKLAEHRDVIDRAFSAGSVKKILTELTAQGAWGTDTLSILCLRSPTSLSLVYRQMQEGAVRDLPQCLAMELAITGNFLKGHDFYEGVRAVLIDKDQNPQWLPARLEDVKDADINAYFTD